MRKTWVLAALLVLGLGLLALLSRGSGGHAKASSASRGAAGLPIETSPAQSPVVPPPAEVRSRPGRVVPKDEASPGPGTDEPVSLNADAREPDPNASHGKLTLSARVVDRDLNPIQGVEFVVWKTGTVAARSDANGNVDTVIEILSGWIDTYYGGAQPTDCDLAILAEGFAGEKRSVTWGLGGTTAELGTILLDPGGELVGTVRRENGDPVPGATILWCGFQGPVGGIDGTPSLDLPRRFTNSGYRPNSRSDDEGRFRLRGVPTGACTLECDLPAFQHVESDILHVTAGSLGDVQLILPEPPPTYPVAGTVRRADGTPVGNALVGWVDEERSLNWPWHVSAKVRTDDAGRFELMLEGPEPAALRAIDPQEPLLRATLHGVLPGGTDVELRLPEVDWIDIAPTDSAGVPIPWSHVRIGSNYEFRTQQLRPAGESGILRVPRPEFPFHVQAYAQGYRTQTFGPFEPALQSERLDLALQPGAAVRGRVTHRGNPVAGASLTIAQRGDANRIVISTSVARQDTPFTILGSAPGSGYGAECDVDGRFTATIHGDGQHTVRVDAEGFPSSMFGPFEWSTADFVDDVSLELESAGSLQGQVLRPAGTAVEGTVVGISDGWGVALTTVVEADGRFRFDDLQPGGWQIRACVAPVEPREVLRGVARPESSPQSVDWDFHIAPGELTTFDLDLTNEGAFILEGRIRLGDVPTEGWMLHLSHDDRPTVGSGISHLTTRIDDEGHLKLALSRGGRRFAEVRATDWRITQTIELTRGTTRWDVEPEMGSLTIRGNPPVDSQGNAWGRIRAEIQTEGGLTITRNLYLKSLATEPSVRAELPVGRGTLLIRSYDRFQPNEVQGQGLAEFEIRAGVDSVVEFP